MAQIFISKFLHSATETGPGHAVILSGSYGVVNGIIANQWYDNKNNKEVYCVDDENSTILFSTKKLETLRKILLVQPLAINFASRIITSLK